MWLYGNYFHLLSKTIRLKSIQNIIMIPLNVMTVNTIWISLRNQLWDKLVSGQRIGRQGTNFPSFPRFEPSSFFDSSLSEKYILQDLKSVLLESEICTGQRKHNNPSWITQFFLFMIRLIIHVKLKHLRLPIDNWQLVEWMGSANGG